mgnify:CR=1 FL=1
MKTKRDEITPGQALAVWCFLIGVIAVVLMFGYGAEYACG